MSDASQQLINKALEKLAGIEAEAAKVKGFINQICEFEGREPMFSAVELSGPGKPRRGLSIGPDDFFSKPFATAVREILTMRKDAGMVAPASIDEIYQALVQGGFRFVSNDPEKQKMGLAVSLGKNTVTFRKLPSGLFGLAEWYGNGKPQRRKVIRSGELLEVDDHTQVPDNDEEDEFSEPEHDEAAESPPSESSAAYSTPNSADEDGREVAHDNMTNPFR